MRVLVCGSRSVGNPQYKAHDAALSERQYIDQTLQLGHGSYSVIIQGDAPGADLTAKTWGWRNGVKVLSFPADWKRYGRSAGYKRNAQMLEEGQPSIVLAFTDKPLAESKGTAMMVRLAQEAGLPVHHFRTDLHVKEF